ncbi:MAG: FAD/NAD(P)-binding protein [Dehalococcoidales bacterium]|nr:FAD/NAD(P)-binding protein [Dehalococcoidales bacterium]
MKNEYLPYPAIIEQVGEETYDTKTFYLKLRDGRRKFRYQPGQFVELSIFGYGEAPISITSSPTEETLKLCVRRIGKVTEKLHALRANDVVGIRGPFGKSFPVAEIKGKDLVFVAGGLGLAPLRSLIKTAFDCRADFGKITVLYGARTPNDLLFRDEYEAWGHNKDTELLTTVDTASEGWQGNVGVVTTLFTKTEFIPEKSVAVVCGPPVMFRFAIRELLKMGFAKDSIVVTLERLMKCGIGKCGHCNIGHKYVCIDGPVFRYSEIEGLGGAV